MNVEKYVEALNNILGADNAYYRGDKDVDAIVELIGIANRQQAEIEKLNVELASMRGACNSYKIHYDNAQAEIEEARIGVKSYKGKYESAVKTAKDLQAVIKEKDAEIERLLQKLQQPQTEAIKEFADLLIKRIRKNVTPIPQQMYLVKMCIQEIYNLVKEMVGEQG